MRPFRYRHGQDRASAEPDSRDDQTDARDITKQKQTLYAEQAAKLDTVEASLLAALANAGLSVQACWIKMDVDGLMLSDLSPPAFQALEIFKGFFFSRVFPPSFFSATLSPYHCSQTHRAPRVIRVNSAQSRRRIPSNY